MKKKILSLILCAAMCIGVVASFTGCSGNNTDAFVIMTEQLDGLFNPFFYTSAPDGTIVSRGLQGGELAAAIITDSVVRLLPGAIGDEASALTDCFQDDLLAPPVYTRPAEFNGWKVPEVLTSGNFAEIAKWQEEQAYERTKALRPDLLE